MSNYQDIHPIPGQNFSTNDRELGKLRAQLHATRRELGRLRMLEKTERISDMIVNLIVREERIGAAIRAAS